MNYMVSAFNAISLFNIFHLCSVSIAKKTIGQYGVIGNYDVFHIFRSKQLKDKLFFPYTN